MENTIENALAFMQKTNRSIEDITNVEMMVAYADAVRPEVKLPSDGLTTISHIGDFVNVYADKNKLAESNKIEERLCEIYNNPNYVPMGGDECDILLGRQKKLERKLYESAIKGYIKRLNGI